jgi:predicted nucleotidyltransferase
MSLSSMVLGLQKAGVRFVVIGGYASMVHGSPRITNDVDVCFDRDPGNLQRLAELLASWSAYPREMEPGLPFIMDAVTLRNASILTLTTREGYLDLLDRVEGVGDFEACLADSEVVDLAGTEFRVLTLDALIRAKRAAGREKDQLHVRELELLREEGRQ